MSLLTVRSLGHFSLPLNIPINVSVEQLRDTLLNVQKSLFLRYRAMFTLRNMNNDEAALALCEGFQDTSALFRHEVAYVLGEINVY